MKHFEIPEHLNDEVDGHLSQSEVFAATVLLRERTGCDIAEAKQAVGMRFRERFPYLFLSYRNLGDDD